MEGQPPRFADWERELRARLGAGDELALAEAYDQFSPMVYGLAVRVTGDRSAAEDVTQEVFLHPEEAAVAKRVRVAVDELPDAQRTAVLLAYFEGRTFRQVAQLTGVPEGTAKSRLRLGLRRIAARLHSEGLPGEW